MSTHTCLQDPPWQGVALSGRGSSGGGQVETHLVDSVWNHRKFFKSPNFDGWFRHRHREMSQKLETLHLEVLGEAVSLWNRTIGSRRSCSTGSRWNPLHQPRMDPQHLFALQDLLGWTRDKSQVETVDLVLKIRERVVSSSPLPPSLAQHQQEVCFSE